MKTAHLMRFGVLSSLVGLGGAIGACAPEFRTECPPGKVRVGNGDVDDDEVCKPVDAGAAGAAGQGGDSGSAGLGGSAGAGAGGMGPPDAMCTQNATKCEGDAFYTCDQAGQWGEGVGCDIKCDAEGKACVAPVQLAAGAGHACARLSDGTVRCWGLNSSGELGLGDVQNRLSPQPVMGVEGAIGLVAKAGHACAIRNDNKGLCWGNNSYKQLQPGGEVQVRSPLAIDSADVREAVFGFDHACLLDAAGSVRCRGRNNYGQMGNGAVSTTAANNFVTTQIPSQTTVTQLSAESATTFAVTDQGQVLCWGRDDNTTGLLCGNQGGADGANDGATTKPVTVPGLSSVQSVDSGAEFACGIVGTNRTVTCWGRNFAGQLGRGGVANDAPQAAAPAASLTQVQQISVGRYHACAATRDGKLFCWGRNDDGQLGQACSDQFPCQANASNLYVSTPMLVPLQNVKEVRAGAEFTCALTNDAKVWCWGRNEFGTIGDDSGGSGAPDKPTPTRVVWKK